MSAIISFLEYLAIVFGIYSLVVIGLNLEVGYAGIPDFGKAMSFGLGMLAIYPICYKLIPYFNTNPLLSIALLVLILILSFVIGFVTGFIVTIPAIRLKEDYLAMYLLGVAVAIIWVLHYEVYKSAATGNYFIGIPSLYKWAGANSDAAWAITMLVVTFITLALVQKLCTSPFGRILKAIRENELVVETYGRNVILFKLITMGIGSGIVAMAGALYALWRSVVSIDVYAQLYWTFIPWLIILLGGLGNMYGAVAGAFIYALFECIFRTYLSAIRLPLGIVVSHLTLWFGFGVAMLLLIIFRPEGILPEKPILTKPIKKLKELKRKESKERQK